MMVKILNLASSILVMAAIVAGQPTIATLATANGVTFTANDLSSNGRKIFDQRDQLWAKQRSVYFDDWIFSILLEAESRSRGVPIEAIRSEALRALTPAGESQIKAVYDANRERLGNVSFEQARAQIVDYLKHEAEDKAINDLQTSLKAKHKFIPGKDINATDLKHPDVVATIGTRLLTAEEFAKANELRLNNFRISLYEQIRSDLEAAIFEKLIVAEAAKRKIDPGMLIASEITNKLKDYSDYERSYLEDSLQEKLFEQYSVKFNTPSPEPIVLKVSADDDPAIGPATAKVTIVAFVDFQCSACASFSPLLKQVVNEFRENVRLVVRDFPLTSIHADAMNAALAAYAARQQGKFFEIGDLMYGNQSNLDIGSLREYARKLGMDLDKFDADMKSPAALAEVRKDIADGNAYGVGGTPTIFINGVQLPRLSTGRLRSAIKQALK